MIVCWDAQVVIVHVMAQQRLSVEYSFCFRQLCTAEQSLSLIIGAITNRGQMVARAWSRIWLSLCQFRWDHVRYKHIEQAADRSPITDSQLSTDTWSEDRYSLPSVQKSVSLPQEWLLSWLQSVCIYLHSICINSSRVSVTWQVVASTCPPSCTIYCSY